MPNSLTYGAFRTGRLWAAAGVSFVVLLLGSGWALLGSLEFDELCAQGKFTDQGRLLDIRRPSFPPAVICEYERGELSAGGTGLLGALLWLSLLTLVLCVLLALLAECVELPAGSPRSARVTRRESLRRTAVAFCVTASVFTGVYVLMAWPLLSGPSTACAAGAEWGFHPPETRDPSFFPPQATCVFRSGETSRLNAEWATTVTAALALPAAIAGTALTLAWRRHHTERRTAAAP
ncbi:hypothetical protein [Streptomyces sp. TRM64462]|uniref:hypothetical protein n=1 Tax=Streptomyces sp. TRM64462 TaxID=2741726 RepID=UPI0015865813|nr:hypothetical protein [Streptomyces sp. TRM64462]